MYVEWVFPIRIPVLMVFIQGILQNHTDSIEQSRFAAAVFADKYQDLGFVRKHNLQVFESPEMIEMNASDFH
jgi:hypothetical protein